MGHGLAHPRTDLVPFDRHWHSSIIGLRAKKWRVQDAGIVHFITSSNNGAINAPLPCAGGVPASGRSCDYLGRGAVGGNLDNVLGVGSAGKRL
jgi:hypothetical protein